jgi:hypothetical protein
LIAVRQPLFTSPKLPEPFKSRCQGSLHSVLSPSAENFIVTRGHDGHLAGSRYSISPSYIFTAIRTKRDQNIHAWVGMSMVPHSVCTVSSADAEITAMI